MAGKRKATITAPPPRVSPPRASKRARKGKAISIEEDDDEFEDAELEEDEVTPPIPSTSKAKTRAAPKKAQREPAPPKGKKAKKPAVAYGTRKQVFHSFHFHVRSVIQSFGELEQIRVVRAQSERAKENAHRKVLREEKEKIQCEIELEKVKTERYNYLGPEELKAEYKILVENKNLEVRRAQDATKEVEAKLAELQIDLTKAEAEKQEAIKDRLAMEDQLLQKKLEVRSTGRNCYINVELRELNLQPPRSEFLRRTVSSPALVSASHFYVAGMDPNSAKFKQLQAAFLQAQNAMAILNGVIDPNDRDDLPAPASNSLIDTDLPTNPHADQGNNTTDGQDNTLDVTPRGAIVGLASRSPRVPPTNQGPLFPAPQPKRDPKIGAQIRKRTQRMFLEDRETAVAEWEAAKPVLAELNLISNPYVARGRQEMHESHCSTLEVAEPHLTAEQHYHTQVILEFACLTLHFRIKHSRGRDGGPIQSRTAVAWFGYHLFNICSFTRDPESGELSGLTLLRRGLFIRLENLVKWCVFEFGLGRHIRHQHVLDRPAIQLIIERVLTNSESHGREVAFQTLTAMSFAMFGAFRSGSLQANCTEYRERKLYMQVGHLKMHVRGWCSIAVEVDVLNWKGYSGEIGHRKTLTFEPVSKAHNLIFEPGCHLALDLLARKMYDGINDIDELINFNKSMLPIKAECQELPLFLKHSARGFGLIEGVPCGPHKLSQVVNHQAIAVGLPGGSIHAIRRGSAQHYANSLGEDRTLTLLNHNDRSGITMANHYVPQTHVPLVAVRLNELEGKLGPAVMRNQTQGSPAIHVLARRLQSTDARGGEIMKQGRCRVTQEEEQEVQKDSKIVEIVTECEDAWKRFTRLFLDANEPFTRHFVSTIDCVRSCSTDASPALVEVRVAELEKLGRKLRDTRRQAFKRVRRANQKTAASTAVSIEMRKQAEQKIDEPSEVIAEAKDRMKAVITEYLKARRGEPGNSNEQYDESDDDEEGIQTVKESLPGRGLPPPATTISNDKPRISQLNISLQSAPKVDIPELEDSAETEDQTFDDTAEVDVLKVPVEVMRAIYMRYIWKAYIQQTNPFEPNAQGKLICVECQKFNSRRDNPDAFTFTRRDKFNRHMREQHDNYSNLELEMQTSDPNQFRCPGCEKANFSSAKSCFKHCREECVASVNFKPLYEAHRATRKTETSDDLARRDRAKEREFIGQEVEFPEDYSETVTQVQQDLLRPGFLADWANSDGVKMSEDVGRGHDLDDLQKLAYQSTEIAIGGAYRSGPGDNDPIEHPQMTRSPLVASGPSVLTGIRDQAVELLETSNPDNMSDYDTESNSEQASASDKDE
ncbi:hypothetical protein RSAG8_13550, partial [Rhizoctonia solani AG-8 WAC10335]